MSNHDELRQSKNERRALSGWEVSQPRFPPTAHRRTTCVLARARSVAVVARLGGSCEIGAAHGPRFIGARLWAGRRGCCFFLSPPTKGPDAAARGNRLSFVESFPEARSVVTGRAASGGEGRRAFLVSVDASHDRTGTPPRTSDRGLEADGDSLEEGEPAATQSGRQPTTRSSILSELLQTLMMMQITSL